jgi:hypothetical protein
MCISVVVFCSLLLLLLLLLCGFADPVVQLSVSSWAASTPTSRPAATAAAQSSSS